MTEKGRQPQNIFEAVSRVEKERREKQAREEEGLKPPEPATSMTESLSHCRRLHEELSSWLEEAFRQQGISRADYLKYISEPRNFSEKEWRSIQDQQRENEDRLQKLSGAPKHPPSPPPKERAADRETEEKANHQKRPKIMTKRRWLGMR